MKKEKLKNIYPYLKHTDLLWSPPILIFNGYQWLSFRGIEAGREADHSFYLVSPLREVLYFHYPMCSYDVQDNFTIIMFKQP